MIRIRSPQLRVGDIVAQSLANPQNPSKILLPSETALSDRVIRLLDRIHVKSMWIHMPGTDSVTPSLAGEALQLYRNVLSCLPLLFSNVREKKADKETFSCLAEPVSRFVAALRGTPRVFALPDDIHAEQDHLMAFAGSVCYLSLLIAQEMAADNQEHALADLNAFAVGALLHEVGKVVLPAELFQKETWDLTQRECDELHSYTVKGYRLLSAHMPPMVAAMALYHHRYANGSGFPQDVMESGILSEDDAQSRQAVQILSIAHAYCELVMRMDYRPVEALEEIACARKMHFRAEILTALTRVAPPFPLGEPVALSSGHSGVPSRFFPEYPFRPEILLLWDKAGDPLPEAQRVALSLPDYPNAKISKMGGRPVDYLMPVSVDDSWEAMQ